MELLRHQRVHRTIELTALVRRGFDDVVEIVERRGQRMLADATDAAGHFVGDLVQHADRPLDGFDSSEPLTVVVADAATASAQHVWIEFTWDADRDKRLLANVRARLDFHPIVPSGRRSTTEVRLRAEYEPPASARHAPEAILFRRRLVRAALVDLLGRVTRFLEDYEDTLELRIG